jgi:hypothetical protein
MKNLQIVDGIFKDQREGTTLQDFCPLAESLEWQLGQRYLRQRASKAFTTDASPVPFVINNDSGLSESAAEVLFKSLRAAEQTDSLHENIAVLEIGIGVGLFARFFLDAFQRLCVEDGKDYYDRLCYVAADCSPRMLIDCARDGLFGNHSGRVRFRVVDAMRPAEGLAQDAVFQGGVPRRFHAVFLNYLLDCLPATALEIHGDEVVMLAEILARK